MRTCGVQSTAIPADHGPGFSTLELAVVLMMASIVLTISLLGVRSALALEQLGDWARAMSYDIEFGRQAAVTSRTTVTVTFAVHSYTVAFTGGVALRRQNLPADISLSARCGGTACTSVSFDRRGLPVLAGSPSPPPPPDTVALSSALTGRTHVVTVQSLTGRVSYQ